MLPAWSWQGLGGHTVYHLQFHEQLLYAATNNGLFSKLVSAEDTLWNIAGLQGKEITDFVVWGEGNLIASVVINAENPDATLYRTSNDGSDWSALESNFGGELAPVTCQALATVPPTYDTLYGRGRYNVAKSTDGGITWNSVFADWDAIGYQADLLEVDARNPHTVWAGGETSIFSPYLLKSSDGGQSWQPMEVPANGDNAVYSLATDPYDVDRVLAGMEGQIIGSDNGGDSWQVRFAPENYSYFNQITFSSLQPDRVYAVGTDGGNDVGDVLLYTSEDGGQQWDVVRFEGDTSKQYAALDLAIATMDDQEIIFIATDQGVVRYSPR